MSKKILIIIAISIIAIAGYYTYKYFTNKSDKSISIVNEPLYTKSPEPAIQKPDKLITKLMFFGDVFWGRFTNEYSMKNELKEAFPFSGLHTLDRENYDAWIGSLNCPITDAQISAQTQEDTLMFNCTPNYLTEARKWFDIFSLANSHTSNQNGMVGFESTRSYLDQYGFQYFGHYEKEYTDEICDIITVNATAYLSDTKYNQITDTNYPVKDFMMPIAMCGYHNTFSLATEEQLNEISKYSAYLPTLVYAIQGGEYNTIADDMQRKYFKAMIDRGADAVIGKGAHVVQDTEAYNGKPIIYSMGNFVYDQQWMNDVMHGIGVKVTYNFVYDENSEKLQNIVAKCNTFKDNCLEQIKILDIKKPTYTVDYDIVATDNSGLTAEKADESLQQEMLIRTNWENTKNNLD